MLSCRGYRCYGEAYRVQLVPETELVSWMPSEGVTTKDKVAEGASLSNDA
jgi:hypothetical protein